MSASEVQVAAACPAPKSANSSYENALLVACKFMSADFESCLLPITVVSAAFCFFRSNLLKGTQDFQRQTV